MSKKCFDCGNELWHIEGRNDKGETLISCFKCGFQEYI